MTKYIIQSRKYGVELDVEPTASRDEKIQAYLKAFGGPQGVLDNYLRYVAIIEDQTPEATIIND